jgi:hypothetical protein
VQETERPATSADDLDKIWSSPIYAAADRARNTALALDSNDQMGALASAIDAAFAMAQATSADDVADGAILLMLFELHSHLPEEQRIMAMSDLSDEQATRARRAVQAVTAWNARAAMSGSNTAAGGG